MFLGGRAVRLVPAGWTSHHLPGPPDQLVSASVASQVCSVLSVFNFESVYLCVCSNISRTTTQSYFHD